MANNTKLALDFLKANYEFRRNLANQKMEWKRINGTDFIELSDEDFNSFKLEITLKNIPCSRETLSSIIFSRQWPSYDPYMTWLDSLPLWDGEDHIKELADTVHTDDDNYFFWCLKKWLVAFVGSLAEENVVNQTAIILCGNQGIGKSTWFTKIMPKELLEHYGMGFLQPKDKETKRPRSC